MMLGWGKDLLVESFQDEIHNRYEQHVTDYLKEVASQYELRLEIYSEHAYQYANLLENALQEDRSIVAPAQQWYWYKDIPNSDLKLDADKFGAIPISFETMAAYARNGLGTEATDQIDVVSPITERLKRTYQNSYHRRFLTGFETDEAFLYYPGYLDIPGGYNPKQETWYHFAVAESPKIIFMEPEINTVDATNDSTNVYQTIIATKALTVSNQVVGVSAVEFMMNYKESSFYYDFNDVFFKTEGFSALLSADGLVLSNP